MLECLGLDTYERETKMKNFDELNLPENIMQAIKAMNFKEPTPIQAQSIPVALDGKDIIGSAQTGTGKTAAFAIPMIAHLMKDDRSMALVLLPTRELAAQVLEAANNMLGKMNHIKSALLIGGDSMVKQLNQLKGKPRIIVGTPGRINDHLSRRSLKLNNANFLVLDETDRMLDMGFGIQLDEIAKYLPKERQTLMFSATLPKNIMALSKKYLTNPVRIACGQENQAMPNIKQEIIKTSEATKFIDLTTQLQTREGSILVFVKTKHGADKLAVRLSKEEHKAVAIHGDLRQSRRDKVIADFRKQKNRILVATDVAARGLDIPHIEHVINYDLPQCPEDYIHRIGRTARAGALGCAVNFLMSSDASKWKEIYKLMNPSPRDQKALPEGDYPISSDPFNTGSKEPSRNSRTRHRKGSSDGSRSSFGERPARARSGSSSGSSFGYGDRPARAKPASEGSSFGYGDRPARAKPASEGSRSSFGDRPARARTDSNSGSSFGYGDKPARSGSSEGSELSFAKKSSRPWVRDAANGKTRTPQAKFNKNSRSFGDSSAPARSAAPSRSARKTYSK